MGRTLSEWLFKSRSERFAIVADPASGLKLELSRSDDSEVHVRHLGFRADDLDSAHQTLVEAGMEVSEAPHRRRLRPHVHIVPEAAQRR